MVTLDVSQPLHELVDEAEEHLALHPNVYQRSGELVHLEHDTEHRVVLKPISTPIMRYLLSRMAVWTAGDDTVHPPTSVASCLIHKTSWHKFRRLRAITTFPLLGADGSLNTEPGYHANTQTYFTGGVECHLPERPTLANAKAAVATLLDVVCDFPFMSKAHAAAWMAGLLSPLARFAHDGNTPIVIIQANGPRIGKTKLAHVVSNILTGYDAPFFVHTKSEDEERKRIMSFLRGGRCMVLIDNVVGQWGGAAINAVTTGRTFEDRVLATSKTLQVQNDTTLFVTANNIILAPDTAERCTNVRLYSADEKPHLRSGWKYPDLLSTVRERRAHLLSSALCILKAYISAGMPDMGLPPWGSYEQWSRLVRHALVWAGMEDPAETREELERDADVGRSAASSLVEGWLALQQEKSMPEGFTCRQVYELLHAGIPMPLLRTALEDIAGGDGRLPNAHTIGRHLREIRDRNFGGLIMRCMPNDKLGHRWYVEEAPEPHANHLQPEGRGTGDRGTGSQPPTRRRSSRP